MGFGGHRRGSLKHSPEPTRRNGADSALHPHHLQTRTPRLPAARFWPSRTPAAPCPSQCAVSGAACLMATACAVCTWNHPRVGWHTHASAAFLPPQSQPAVHKEKHPSSGPDPRPALPTHLPTPSVRLGSEGPGAPGNPSLLMVLDLLPTQAVHCFLAQGKRTVSECPPRPRNSKIFVILCKEVHLSSKGGVLEYLYTHI